MNEPPLILMYHRVATPGVDPFGLCVTPRHFREHVDVLSSSGWAAPLSRLRSRSTQRRLIVTFDDGYQDNATVAAPLLAAAGLPATWFITVGCLDAQPFWWDRLAYSLLDRYDGPTSLELPLGGVTTWMDLHTLDARRRALRLIHRRLLPLPPTALMGRVDELVDLLGTRRPPHDVGGMTTTQLEDLAKVPGFEIGAHTMTHARLNGQPAVVQHNEIVGSVKALTTLLGVKVTSFAYPFGGVDAIGPLAPTLVRRAGCTLACTTRSGHVMPWTKRLSLPRLTVGDWSGGEFQEALHNARSAP
jgi:peptidoglycan/xylan/chitin deacetylase (PgdA/CDA1 family)